MYWDHESQGFVDQLGGGGAAVGRYEVMGREKVRAATLTIKQKELIQNLQYEQYFLAKK